MVPVSLIQANYRFGDNAFLPYSVGRLWAHAKRDPVVAECYYLDKLIAFRDDDLVFSGGVVGISCYIWNWRFSLHAARLAEMQGCFVVLGGPQVPEECEGFFDEHPYVHAIVHGEGEAAFTALLKARIQGRSLESIPGVSVPGHIGSPSRSDDLSFPSPYLDGVFDQMIEQPYNWHLLQETHRGCPYSCTFCDWGSAVFTKVREFPTEMINAEIDWAAAREIELIYNCDANFGILKRDADLADHMIETKRRTGYPRKLRAAYAKKTTQTLFETACRLSDADLSKGVTLSFQSLDEEVLSNVKRRNIAFDDFATLIRRYRERKVPTYTELILGLPGETANSFLAGLDKLLDAGQHTGINIYPLILLPNSEINQHREDFDTVEIDQLLLHGTPDAIREKAEWVVGTPTMPLFDWLALILFSWMFQAVHCLGTARLAAPAKGETWIETYLRLFVREQPYRQMHKMLSGILASALVGDGWKTTLPFTGNMIWPPEEWIHLKFMEDHWKGSQKAFEEYAINQVWYGRKGSVQRSDPVAQTA